MKRLDIYIVTPFSHWFGLLPGEEALVPWTLGLLGSGTVASQGFRGSWANRYRYWRMVFVQDRTHVTNPEAHGQAPRGTCLRLIVHSCYCGFQLFGTCKTLSTYFLAHFWYAKFAYFLFSSLKKSASQNNF